MTDLNGLTVVTDLDNTALKYNDGLADFVFAATGRRVPSTCPSYSFAESKWFASTEEFLAVHTEAVQAGLFSQMDAYDGAAEALASLRAAGARLKVVTYRTIAGCEDLVRETTIAGLARVGIEYDELHFARDKHTISADIYIDDAPYVISALDERGLERIVFDQEYNQPFAGSRARSWEQVPGLVRERLLTGVAA